jgi:hypothetical protein
MSGVFLDFSIVKKKRRNNTFLKIFRVITQFGELHFTSMTLSIVEDCDSPKKCF